MKREGQTHTNPHYLLNEGASAAEELKDDWEQLQKPQEQRQPPAAQGEISNIDKLYKKVMCKPTLV